MPFERFGDAFLRVDRTLVQEFLTETEGRDVLEASLITTENPEVARLDIQVLDDCPGDLSSFSSVPRVELKASPTSSKMRTQLTHSMLTTDPGRYFLQRAGAPHLYEL